MIPRLLLAGALLVVTAVACVAYWAWDRRRLARQPSSDRDLARTLAELQRRRRGR